jgi:DNA-directed RNA polymerase subunit E'/Rpb7
MVTVVMGTATMEQLAVFEERLPLSPTDLHVKVESVDDILLKKLKRSLEGKCSRHGYVLKDTLQLLSRSMGTMEKGRFTGEFMYSVKAQGKVYNPPDGTIVEGKVLRKNKMGIYVIVANAIKIMIPRDLHIGNAEFDSIEVNETIQVEIKKSKFQINDMHILSIGQFLGRVGPAPALVRKEEEEEEAAVALAGPSEEQAGEEEEQEEEQEEEEEEAVGDEEEEKEEEKEGEAE